MHTALISSLLGSIGNLVAGIISKLALILPSSGRTATASAVSGVPAGNQVTVTTSTGSVPLEYTVGG